MFRWGDTYRRVYSDDEPPFDGKKPIPLTCPICGIHTDAKVVGMSVTPSSDFVQLPNLEMQVYNFLVRCTHCESGLLVMWSYGPDRMLHVSGAGTSAGRLVYPPPTSAFQTEKLPKDVIPAAVFEDLRQAELAYFAGRLRSRALASESLPEHLPRATDPRDAGEVEGPDQGDGQARDRHAALG